MIELPRSLNIYRDRLTDMSPSFDRIHDALDQKGINDRHIHWVGVTATKSMILSDGEIGGLIVQHRQHVDAPMIDQLADYIGDHLPGSAGAELIVPAQELNPHTLVSRPEQLIISVGAENRTLNSERRTAMILTEEFFGVDGQENDWPVWDYSPELPLMRIMNVHTARKVIDILDKYPDLLPPSITLSPVVIKKTAS